MFDYSNERLHQIAAEVLQTRGIDASILTGGLAQWQRA